MILFAATAPDKKMLPVMHSSLDEEVFIRWILWMQKKLQMLNPDRLEIPAPFIQLKQISDFRVPFMYKLAWLKRPVQGSRLGRTLHTVQLLSSEQPQSVDSPAGAQLICPYQLLHANLQHWPSADLWGNREPESPDQRTPLLLNCNSITEVC